jgi:alpha-mannosidase
MTRRQLLSSLAYSAVSAQLGRAAESSVAYSKIREVLAKRKLFIVPYSHTDWAYTHSRQWQADRAALVLSEVLDLLRKHPGFRYFIDTWNEMTEPFLDRHPERSAELREAIHSGRLTVCGGTVCNSHPVLMEPEALIRDMVMGRRYFRRLAPQANLDVMVHYDVMPGPSQMPQILRKAGFKSYRFFRPMEGMDAERKPRSFVWRGPDGSEILTSRGYYGGLKSSASLTDSFASHWDAAMATFYEKEVADLLKLQPAHALWIAMGGDDVRPLRDSLYAAGCLEKPMELVRFVEEWNRRESAPLGFATPQEYFRELEKERAELPNIAGILDATQWTHWFGRDGRRSLHVWRAAVNDEIVAAERFASCAASLGDAYPEDEFTRAWRNLFTFSSHAQSNLYAEDYQQQAGLAADTLWRAKELGKRSMSAIASRVKVRPEGMPVLLFNELPWPRTEVVRIWAQVQELGTRNLVVRDSAGRVVPHQAIDINEIHGASKEIFKEANLLVKVQTPALGYTTLYVGPASGVIEIPVRKTDVQTLRTGFADLTFQGDAPSLFYKPAARTYTNFGDILFREIAGDDFGPVQRTGRMQDIRLLGITEGQLRTSYTYEGTIGRDQVRVTGHVYPHAERISFETEIDSHGGRGHFLATMGLPEAGKLVVDTHFGIEDRDVSKIAYQGAERRLENVFYGSHWVDCSSGGYGAAIVGCVGEKGYLHLPQQSLLGHILLRTTLPATQGWERFVTDARLGRGMQTFEYHVLLHQGDWRGVVRRAIEAQFPLRPVFIDQAKLPAERILPEEKSFVRVEPDTVLMSGFYRDNGRYLMRVYQCADAGGKARIDLPFRATSAQITNFHGEPLPMRKAELSNASVRFDLGPWEIVTIALV